MDPADPTAGDSVPGVADTLSVGGSDVGVLAPGERLGRYAIDEIIGIGGMATVYAARDPELGRTVALKVLRSAAAESRTRAELLREAQALALLSDPHVVPVFDVGVDGGRVFLAMPIMPGGSLGEWLEQASRPWPQIVAMFLDAGRGLQAAHEAGLVHGDFKPGNVLLGADGRAKVVDFGLARRHGTAIAATGTASAVPLSDVRTVDGLVRGTPAYMAPEQLRGGALDARTDVFAFCVALWWALMGHHPFASGPDAHDAEAVRARVLAGRVVVPRELRGVPPSLRRALQRGLAADPDARWPAMAPLLRQLQATVRPRRLRLAAIAAATAGGLALLASLRARGPDCDGAAALGEAWTPARRDAIAERVQQLGLPYGRESLAVIEQDLDAWAGQWRSHYDVRCRGSAPDRDAVLSCLAELRAGLAATVDARVDAARLPHAIGSVDALPRPASCERVLWRLAQDAAASGLRQAAAEVAALDAAGEYDAALAAARALWARASAPELDDDPALQALAQRLLGDALEREGDYEGAAAMLTSAAYLALRSGDDALAAGTMADLIKVLGTDLGRVDEARAWERHAEAALARLPEGDPTHAAVRNAQGLLAIEAGEPERAITLLGETVSLLREDDASLDVRRSSALNNYANALLDAGRFDDARAAYQRALALRERRLGAAHPQVASTLSNLGLVAERQGDTVGARQFHERAISVARAGLGEDHPTMAELTNNLAVLDYSLGDIARAKAGFTRTLALVRAGGSRGHRAVARVLGNLALCETESGDPAAALPLLDEALALQLASLGPDHPDVAMTLNNRGSAQRRLGRLAAAQADYARALEIRTQVLGEHHGERGQTLDNLGLVALAQGDAAGALALHEQALAIFTALHGEQHDKVAGALVHRSTAELALGQREVALASARRARAILEAVVEPDPIELARAQLAEAAAEPEPERARRSARQALAALQREGARADADVEAARALLQQLGG